MLNPWTRKQIFDLKAEDYKPWCNAHGLPLFTLSQVKDWVVKKYCRLWLHDQYFQANQQRLNGHLLINPFLSCQKYPASDGSATKYVFEISPHVFIESVAIQEKGIRRFVFHLKLMSS